jgi:hypothetical protein
MEVITLLLFKLNLPDWLKIHLVVSIDHVKPVVKDPYKRPTPEPGLIHNKDRVEKYIIERITKKEMVKQDEYRTQ